MYWIIISMVCLGAMFTYFGWKWERNAKRPEIKKYPLVSILIPSYKSPHLEETVESAKAIDYPNKEIFVVSDSETPKLEGVKIISSKERLGKSNSLNKAIKYTKGEILFFIDSDTTVNKDVLKKLVPWFQKGVAAVSPKFVIQNKKNILTRLISLEHQFISSLFKIHMYFGSLLSFRGCGIAIKRDVFLEVGGWRETLIEDTDMAATLLNKGYKILYDPKAVIKTREPETWREFSTQRLRWGKGTGFSFIKHRRFYAKNPQFIVYLFPYILLMLAIVSIFLYQTTMFMLPLATFYIIYSVSLKELLWIGLLFVIPLSSSIATSTTIASISHFAIITSNEREEAKDLLMILPYVFVFFPFTIACYVKGIISSIADKRKKRGELNLKDW